MHCFGQQGLMPALDSDMAEVITGSKFIVKTYADSHSLTATAINDLIKNVLKNPQFNVDEFDTDMLQRLSATIDSGNQWLQVCGGCKWGYLFSIGSSKNWAEQGSSVHCTLH
jgi:hypothetical protein